MAEGGRGREPDEAADAPGCHLKCRPNQHDGHDGHHQRAGGRPTLQSHPSAEGEAPRTTHVPLILQGGARLHAIFQNLHCGLRPKNLPDQVLKHHKRPSKSRETPREAHHSPFSMHFAFSLTLLLLCLVS
eukprot:scaffold935_cov248-Pinguiococcus_pyrenoidosus.AAC.13